VIALAASTTRLAQLIRPLREAPRESAVLSDVDGTLAPIFAKPGGAAVPSRTRVALRELAQRFALVACVSGRRAADARRVVGVDELTYVGNHGLELLTPGDEDATLDEAAANRGAATRDFVRGVEAAVNGAGLGLEDKGPIQALHWRGAADPAAAEREARRIAERAREAGLEPHWGRMVLELRPVAGIDKGTGVRRLLEGRGLKLALFAGDDRTDLDAFRALRSLVEEGQLRAAVCIGVASDEAPKELAAESDALVAGPAALLDTLRALSVRADRGEGSTPG
jgi:trehalose 6-phosphate phosphatase